MLYPGWLLTAAACTPLTAAAALWIVCVLYQLALHERQAQVVRCLPRSCVAFQVFSAEELIQALVYPEIDASNTVVVDLTGFVSNSDAVVWEQFAFNINDSRSVAALRKLPCHCPDAGCKAIPSMMCSLSHIHRSTAVSLNSGLLQHPSFAVQQWPWGVVAACNPPAADRGWQPHCGALLLVHCVRHPVAAALQANLQARPMLLVAETCKLMLCMHCQCAACLAIA